MTRLARPSTLLLVSLSAAACGGKGGDAKGEEAPVIKMAPKAATLPKPDVKALLARAQRDFAPLPAAIESADNPLSDAKIELGRMLYFDGRLSKAGDVACESCHHLAEFGVDGEPTSPGHQGQRGDRNSPTVYNAGLHLAQFWDGRAATLEEQAKGPILNPIEMAMPDEAAAVAAIQAVPAYVEKFGQAFPGEGVTYANIARAIAAFERKLVTPGPFDRFLTGDTAALSESALQGLQLFYDAGCITCHTGAGLGGTMYQKLGSVKPYETKDVGRFAVTKVETDKYLFKVPTLRNVAKTGPWMHDGSITDLSQMVKIMVEHQTSKGTLTEAELGALLAFLDALTGELPTAYIRAPTLP